MEYLQPRFPSIPNKAPHYESIYLTAAHPSNGTTYWIRHTIRKEPGKEPVGSLWFTKFTPDGPRAGKVNAPPGTSKGRPIAIGDHGWVSRDGATGSLSVPGLEASWELSFSGTEEPMSHLPKPWLYSAPVPRTKSTSP
ncbi:MAG TPA: hypothetical protein VLI04_10710 [Nocardioidaceae bacterium]|nr:hypothetical protein [Nocardioidaceae bacterium]